MDTQFRPEDMGVKPDGAWLIQSQALRRSSPAAPRARRGLLIPDLIALTLSVGVTLFTFSVTRDGLDRVALLVSFIPVTIAIGQAQGLYARDRERADHTTADEIAAIFQVVTLASWLILAASVIAGAGTKIVGSQIPVWALAMGLMPALRAGARIKRRRRQSLTQNTVIVGAGDIGQMVADKLLRNPRFGCRLVGFVDAHPREREGTLVEVPVLGGLEALDEVISELHVERVMIAFSEDSQEKTAEVVRSIADHRVQVDIVPRLFEVVGPRASIHALEGLPLLGLPPRPAAPLMSAAKRLIDIVASGVALIVLSPLLVMIAVGIKLDSPGPVFYQGERIGRNGRRFKAGKFRTMYSTCCRGDRYGADAAEAQFAELMGDAELRKEFEQTHKLRNDPRVTKFGGRLRRSYLDELPQLWNVLRGHLSLVGPRPITAEEFSQLELEAAAFGIGPGNGSGPYNLPGYWELDSVRPGLTGYWQITGGSRVGYAERLRLDLLYAADWSLKLDLLIAVKTLAVLARRGTC